MLITFTHLETGMNVLCKQAICLFWSLVHLRVYETKVRDIDELQQCLLDVWHGLEQWLIDDAVDQ